MRSLQNMITCLGVYILHPQRHAGEENSGIRCRCRKPARQIFNVRIWVVKALCIYFSKVCSFTRLRFKSTAWATERLKIRLWYNTLFIIVSRCLCGALSFPEGGPVALFWKLRCYSDMHKRILATKVHMGRKIRQWWLLGSRLSDHLWISSTDIDWLEASALENEQKVRISQWMKSSRVTILRFFFWLLCQSYLPVIHLGGLNEPVKTVIDTEVKKDYDSLFLSST